MFLLHKDSGSGLVVREGLFGHCSWRTVHHSSPNNARTHDSTIADDCEFLALGELPNSLRVEDYECMTFETPHRKTMKTTVQAKAGREGTVRVIANQTPLRNHALIGRRLCQIWMHVPHSQQKRMPIAGRTARSPNNRSRPFASVHFMFNSLSGCFDTQRAFGPAVENVYLQRFFRRFQTPGSVSISKTRRKLLFPEQ